MLLPVPAYPPCLSVFSFSFSLQMGVLIECMIEVLLLHCWTSEDLNFFLVLIFMIEQLPGNELFHNTFRKVVRS